VFTDCQVLDALEAAHIKPYRGESDNHPENGLLLRADIHTLFDLNLIGIEPKGLQITISKELSQDANYKKLAGLVLNCNGQSPSRIALESRFSQFQMRNGI
jgi:predicted restriction endonuclease